MTCHEARELLSALLDEALSPEESAPLEAHLATCTECRGELERLRRTVALVQALPPEHAPSGFVDRVTAAAHPTRWTTRLARGLLTPWRIKLPLEAAALLLVGGLAVLVFRGTEEQQHFVGMFEPPPSRRDEAASAPPGSATPKPATPEGTVSGPRPATAQRAPAWIQPSSRPAREKERSLDTAARRADEFRAEASRKREMASGVEPDRRQPAGPAGASASSGATTDKDVALGKLSDRRASAPEVQEGAARDLGARARAATKSVVAPDVRGTLAVADPRATATEIARVARRLDGVVSQQHDDGASQILEVAVGRLRYGDLVRELAGLGQWRTEVEIAPDSLPPLVRVTIRVVPREISR